MKKTLLSFVLLLSAITHAYCQSKTYYVSPGGNDSNSGLSKNAAWKTIERVNQVTFQAGDAILFELGGVWNGQLRPQGNGASGKPIVISSYGKGPLPVINMGKTEGAGIYLVNQSWWKIQGVEITSGAQAELNVWRGGIMATVEGEAKTIEHIEIRDCYIHDIWGLVGGDKSGFAIYVGPRVLGDTKCKNCNANDILVENNIIKRVDKVGIATNGQNNVVVRGNYLENLGGDGIVVINAVKGMVEHNIADRTCLRSGDPDLNTGGEKWWSSTAAIWLWRCTESVMQFNEVYNTGKQLYNGDGMSYDFDYGCKRCILQYNYSANNYGGFLLIMNLTNDNIVRYNISQNDQNHLIDIRGNTIDGNLIYNNIFYVDHSTVDLKYHQWQEKSKDSTGATYRNNIFYANGQGRFQAGGSKFYRNCYFGPWKNGLPDDPEALLADPMFVAPGTGGIGLKSLNGYMLKDGSPCINKGVSVADDNKRDFFGNPIKSTTLNIGVYQHADAGANK